MENSKAQGMDRESKIKIWVRPAHEMKCKCCVHFKITREGNKGGVYGRCKLKGPYDYRMGNYPGCKKYMRDEA